MTPLLEVPVGRVTGHVSCEPSSWIPNHNGVMKAYRFERESRMGTGGEWVEVILSAVFLGGGMLLWDLWRGNDERMKQALSLSNLLGVALLSLTFGVATTLSVRTRNRYPALHWFRIRTTSTLSL